MVEELAQMVDEDLTRLVCPRCNTVGKVALSRAGQHIKATCAVDGAYIKFVRQKLSAAERAYWDARKSQ